MKALLLFLNANLYVALMYNPEYLNSYLPTSYVHREDKNYWI